ncbi:unnamed protein product [Arabidopsis thaliana]|uniref:(thale cress) hypothetical protein n=1 Tax=Arabidopsis thaliana TaxID=3702 RepID=A0A7G2F191_ARATH|nr:unnamed protein product [Arabidopsis thaliana]
MMAKSLNHTPSVPVHVIRLDYPGVGPEHSFLKDVGRAEYFSVTDEEALEESVSVGGNNPGIGDIARIGPSGEVRYLMEPEWS